MCQACFARFFHAPRVSWLLFAPSLALCNAVLGAEDGCLEGLAHPLHVEQRSPREVLENGLQDLSSTENLTPWDVGCSFVLDFLGAADIVVGILALLWKLTTRH